MNSNGINGICPCDDGWGSLKYSTSHHGVDIGWLTKYGAKRPVKAWADGTVVQSGQIKEKINGKWYYPTVVVLKHSLGGKTIFTRYWHLVKGSAKVKKGQKVKQGQQIGVRGNTGKSGGTHLHFEIKICPSGTSYKKASTPWNRYNVNPAKYTFVKESQHWKNGDFKLSKCPTLTIIADEIRIRQSASTESSVMGTVEKGDVYEVLNIKKQPDYIWYKIGPEKWVAGKDEWVVVE